MVKGPRAVCALPSAPFSSCRSTLIDSRRRFYFFALGSRFSLSSLSLTFDSALSGTSSLAVQRMAFRTSLRKSGSPQFLWE